MTLTPAQQRALIARESAWIEDGQFAPLDLSGFPSLNELPPEKGRDDDRFAKDWRDTALSASASALRAFVSDPDAETLERIGNEIGHEGFRDEVRQRKGESVCARFKAANPGYLPTDNNYSTVVETLGFNAVSAADQEGTIDEQVAALIDDALRRFAATTLPLLQQTWRVAKPRSSAINAGSCWTNTSDRRIHSRRASES